VVPAAESWVVNRHTRDCHYLAASAPQTRIILIAAELEHHKDTDRQVVINESKAN